MIPPATPVQPQETAFDLGNQMLAEGPARLVTSVVNTPLGQRLALTIRTASTTLTLFLAGADAKNWAAQLKQQSDQMSSAGLVTAAPMPAGPLR